MCVHTNTNFDVYSQYRKNVEVFLYLNAIWRYLFDRMHFSKRLEQFLSACSPNFLHSTLVYQLRNQNNAPIDGFSIRIRTPILILEIFENCGIKLHTKFLFKRSSQSIAIIIFLWHRIFYISPTKWFSWPLNPNLPLEIR